MTLALRNQSEIRWLRLALSALVGVFMLLGSVGFFLAPTSAHAVNFGCLLGGCGSPQRDDDSRAQCKVCLYSKANFQGSKVCTGENEEQGKAVIDRDAFQSWKWHNCKSRPMELIMGQGLSPDSWAARTYKMVDFPNGVAQIDASGPWDKNNGEHYAVSFSVAVDGAAARRQSSFEWSLPWTIRANDGKFDPLVRLPHESKVYVAYHSSRQAHTQPLPHPKPGERLIRKVETNLPGGCSQTVLGSNSIVLPERSVPACNGAARVITANTVCTIRTQQGTSAVGVTPLLATGALIGAPTVQATTEPTRLALASHFKTIRGKQTAAWFFNDSPNAVQIDCAG